MNYELIIKNENGEIHSTKQYRSINKMAQDTGLKYHLLKKIYDNNNAETKLYKKTILNNLLKTINIVAIQPKINNVI